MKPITLLLTVLLLIPSAMMFAQEGSVSVTLFGNALMPLGQFGRHESGIPEITRRFGFDYGDRIGLAGMGFGFGAEVRTPVLAPEVFWVISVQYLLHSTNTADIRSMIADGIGGGAVVDYEMGNWLNIPVLTGLVYAQPLSENVKAYGTAQAGLDITRAPYRKVTVNGVLVEDTDFKIMPAFGFSLGVGVELMNRFDIGVRYLDFGSLQYEGTRRLNPSFFTTVPRLEMDIPGDERPVSTMLLMVGYRL
jgi:hypothetical protein